MKKNLRLTCLFFLVFLIFTVGFVSTVSADVDTGNDNYSYSKVDDSSKWGKVDLPTTEYPIWGYVNKNYNFSVNYTDSPNNYSTTTMIFYWDCLGNRSDHYHFLLSGLENDTGDSTNRTAWKCNNQTWCCRHKWDKTGNYSVAVGIFKSNNSGNEEGEKVSYWIPVEIKDNTTIEVSNIFMMDEKEDFDGNYSDHLYDNTSCGYLDNDYSFSVKLDAFSRNEADNRTINETTTVIYWDYSFGENESDNSILGNVYWTYSPSAGNKSDNSTSEYVYWNYNSSAENESKNRIHVTWNENFTHEWDTTGKKNISARTYHWDPLDGSEVYSGHKNTSILIIRDPKNFVPIAFLSNLQTKGLLLSFLGLIIFFFTYTRNNVPVKISLAGLKPFYLRSVNSFTGTLTFITGMYLYFVFGRCPWDIPIVSSLDWLSNMYFRVLYCDYMKFSGIPCLSILLGLIDVLTLSLIIHLIAVPLYKRELKFEKLSRIKSSSTSAQPRQ